MSQEPQEFVFPHVTLLRLDYSAMYRRTDHVCRHAVQLQPQRMVKFRQACVWTIARFQASMVIHLMSIENV